MSIVDIIIKWEMNYDQEKTKHICQTLIIFILWAANHCLTYHDVTFVLGREVEYTIDYSFIVITAVVTYRYTVLFKRQTTETKQSKAKQRIESIESNQIN